METKDSKTQEQESREKVQKSRAFWNKFYAFYQRFISPNFKQSNMCLANLLGIGKSGSILEVACGDGTLATELFLRKRKDCRLICTDISESMINLTAKKLETVIRLANQEGGLIGYEEELGKVSLEGVKDSGEDSEELKHCFEAYNTECRFGNNLELSQAVEENSIETLISCFSLHLVPDRLRMAKECLKVLKPGGRAGFSIWGSQTETNYFDLVEKKINEIQGSEFLKGHDTSNWYLGQENRLKELLEEAGFVHISICERFMPFRQFEDPEFEEWYNMTEMRLRQRDLVIDFKLLKKLVIDEFKRIYSNGEFLGFNVKFAICSKPL